MLSKFFKITFQIFLYFLNWHFIFRSKHTHSLHLMKHRIVIPVNFIPSIDIPKYQKIIQPTFQLILLMSTRMRSQQILLINIIRIRRSPGDMINRNIKHIKIILSSHNRIRVDCHLKIFNKFSTLYLGPKKLMIFCEIIAKGCDYIFNSFLSTSSRMFGVMLYIGEGLFLCIYWICFEMLMLFVFGVVELLLFVVEKGNNMNFWDRFILARPLLWVRLIILDLIMRLILLLCMKIIKFLILTIITINNIPNSLQFDKIIYLIYVNHHDHV